MASRVPSSRDTGPYEDRRLYPRAPVALPAFLEFNGNRYAVQILDLSLGGAKVDCPAVLSLGAAVRLDCGTLCRAAAVRWQDGRLCGLCFETELNAIEVAALMERSRALAALMKTRE
jgi:hypothetical protein